MFNGQRNPWCVCVCGKPRPGSYPLSVWLSLPLSPSLSSLPLSLHPSLSHSLFSLSLLSSLRLSLSLSLHPSLSLFIPLSLRPSLSSLPLSLRPSLSSSLSLSVSLSQVFDQYVKTRAEEERYENKNKILQAREGFKTLMDRDKRGLR